MTYRDMERRPVCSGTASKITGGRSGDQSTDLDAMLHRADHALLLVRGIKGGGTRRRVMFSLPHAHRALETARSQGYPASLALVRLLPVGHVDLEAVDHD